MENDRLLCFFASRFDSSTRRVPQSLQYPAVGGFSYIENLIHPSLFLCQHYGLGAVGDAQLGQDIRHVLLDRI